MSVERNCPLCDGVPKYGSFDISRDLFAVECPRCGRFKISEMASVRPEEKALLSAFCRRAKRGNDFVTILSDNVEQLISSLPKYSPPEKLDILQIMADMTPALGEGSDFDVNNDYPLIIARSPVEAEYFMNELFNRGYLHEGALTLLGWERLEQTKESGRTSTRCFVAMRFDDSMREIYDQAIEPAIADAGYEGLRIDRHEHVNRIDDEIVGQIRRSRFMVADLTGQGPGVFFEAGLMLGIGRNVIWMCRKEELSEGTGLHFDVRQFNFIAYESAVEARKRLYDRILAVEGEGPMIKSVS